MYPVSQNFKNYIKQASRTVKSKVIINGNIYEDDVIVEMSQEETVNPSDDFSLGSVASTRFDISFTEILAEVLEGTEVKPYIGLDVNGVVEYVPLGVFNVDKAPRKNKTMNLVCFDNMIRLEKPYSSNLSYPATLQAVANEIAQMAGVTFISVLSNHSIEKIEGYTLREAIGFIASAAGGFARFNRLGELEIVFYSNTDVSITADNYVTFETEEHNFTVGKVTAVLGETSLSLGDGNEIAFENPIITQSILQSVYNSLNGFTYMPYSLQWQGNPAIMAGDKIAITDLNSVTYNTIVTYQKIYYSGGLKAETKAIGKNDNASEFSSNGSMSAKLERYVIEQANIKVLLAEKATIVDLEAVDARIDNLVVNTAQIADLAVTNAKVANAAIDSAKIANLAVGTAHIQDVSITTAKIANASITTALIVDANITTAKIANLAVDNAKIANATITGAKIANATIGTAQIANGAITTALIGTGAIQTAQIADGSITDAKIVNLTAGKIVSGTIDTSQVTVMGTGGKLKILNNRLQIFDNQAVPIERVSIGDVNGDGSVYGFRVRGADGTTILLDENGVKKEGITDGAITNAKISSTANIDGAKLLDDSIGGGKLVVDAITSREIASRTITANEIAINTITAASGVIADAAVTSAMIVDASITNAKIVDLDAAKITTGYLSANRIAANTITVDKLVSVSPNLALPGWDMFDQLATNQMISTTGGYGNLTACEISSDMSYVGSESLKISASHASSYKYLGDTNRITDASAGDVFIASIYAKTTTASTTARIAVVFRDVSNNAILVEYTDVALTNTMQWTRLYKKSTAPANTAKVSVYLRIPVVTASTVYFDTFQLEKVVATETQPSTWKPCGTTVINAGNITTGILTLGGDNVNTDGAIIMKDSLDVEFGSIDKSGIIMQKPLQVTNSWAWNQAGYGEITGTQSGTYASYGFYLQDDYPNPGGEYWNKQVQYDLDTGGLYMKQWHGGGFTTDIVYHEAYIGADPNLESQDRAEGVTHFRYGWGGLRIKPYDTLYPPSPVFIEEDVVLPNNKGLKGRNTSGASANLAYVDASNNSIFGTISRPTILNSSLTPSANINGNIYAMFHTGNLDSLQIAWTGITLQNGWVNYGGLYFNAAYSKKYDGEVKLRGSVKSGTVGAVVGNLPVGCRPSKRRKFIVLSDNAIGRIDVETNGDVIMMYGSNAWVSLDNIAFKAD